MYADPSGHSFIAALIIGALLGGLAGGVYGGITAYVNETDIYTGILAGALGGLVMGVGASISSAFLAPVVLGGSSIMGLSAVSSLGIGITVSFASGATGGFVSEFISQKNTYGKVTDWKALAYSSLEYGVINTFGAFLGSFAYTSKGIFAISDIIISNHVFNSFTGVAGLIIDTFK